MGSFILGINFERKTGSEYCDVFKRLPALPLYGTVSAATPFVPAPDVKVNRVSQIMRYGFPGLSNIRSFDNYVLSYDRRTRVAHWVFEHLTADMIKACDDVDRGKCNFMPDESIHQFFR